MYIIFQNQNERDVVYTAIKDVVVNHLGIDCATTEKNVEVYTRQWITG